MGVADEGVLYVIVCAAGVAGGVGELVAGAREAGWEVQVVATPAALEFLDVVALERLTGRAVRSRYRRPSEPKPPRPGAIIVAPATFNTINKFAAGIADTYALGLLAEAPGLGIPVVVLPCVSDALVSRAAYRRSVAELRAEGVRVLSVDDGGAEGFPWGAAVAALPGMRDSGRRGGRPSR
ncbi:flavoprotein [Microtetraspora sp. NBRC 13810]|uniref:flavoprotein n=1 Tax=Microtetraspora sp. NBRC 13810 TaxID=3030990 RepID=UPI00255758CC|nr:flavoprotein [Microtetraspora sp. NBRC 13810]